MQQALKVCPVCRVHKTISEDAHVLMYPQPGQDRLRVPSTLQFSHALLLKMPNHIDLQGVGGSLDVAAACTT